MHFINVAFGLWDDESELVKQEKEEEGKNEKIMRGVWVLKYHTLSIESWL